MYSVGVGEDFGGRMKTLEDGIVQMCFQHGAFAVVYLFKGYNAFHT